MQKFLLLPIGFRRFFQTSAAIFQTSRGESPVAKRQMAERGGFEAQDADSQCVNEHAVAENRMTCGTENGTQGAVEDYSTLARIVEIWPRLNANLKAAIGAIIASQEKNEPDMRGM